MPPGAPWPPVRRRRRWPWWAAAAGAAVATVLVITLVVHGASKSHPTTPPSSSTRPPASASPAPTAAPLPSAQPPAVDPATLPALLGSAEQVGKVLNNVPMDARAVQTSLTSGVSINPDTCASAVAPVLEGTYAGSGYTGLAVQGLQEPKPGRRKVIQAVVAFPDAAAAQHFYAQQLSVWQGCKLTDVTVSYTNGQPDDHAKITVVTGSEGIATTVLLPAGPNGPKDSECERAMSARRNIVVDVRACGPNTITAGFMLIRMIDDNITSHP
ncbi:hypothetical protein MKSMC1_25630 [Mycobacterium kansasii]|nr:hypothetical protein MKSMC1_25630 [Mycobacterium kansasii]